MMHLNSRQYRCFLHDVHHAYLLLHRALRTIPPTMIPDLEPMPHPSEGLRDQHDALQPDGPLAVAHDIDSPEYQPSPGEAPDSPTETFFQAVLRQPLDAGASDSDPAQPCQALVPAPVRHLEAPDPVDIPFPKPTAKAKKPAKRPRPKKSPTKKSPGKKKPLVNIPSEAASPWSQDDLALLIQLKNDKQGRPSWKAIAARFKRSESDVRNQWSLIQANLG